MKLVPYWGDTSTPFAGGAEGPVEGRAEVAVVGGGFTGLSAALELAKRGAEVVVLEAGRVAAGQSGRNGGHVNNGLAHDFGGVASRLGLDRARALYRAYDDAVDTVERVVAEERIDCDFRRSGKIKLAAKPGHWDGLARGFELLHREADPETELVPRERLRGEVGSDAFHGGLLYRKSAQMHMGRFGAGLAAAAARRGARIFENAPVTGLKRAGRRRGAPPDHGARHGRGEAGAAGDRAEPRRADVPAAAADPGRQLHRGDGAADGGAGGFDHADAAHRDHHLEHRQLLPHRAGQPADLRRARALRHLQPGLRRQERTHPASAAPADLPADRRRADRILLGRRGGHDGRPAAARGRTGRAVLRRGVQRARRADVRRISAGGWRR